MTRDRIPGTLCQVKNWFEGPMDSDTLTLVRHEPPGPRISAHRVSRRQVTASASAEWESFYPDFADPDEPPRAGRRYTVEFRQRASTQKGAAPLLDNHGIDMGGHIQNLRDLLAENGIGTELIVKVPEVRARASYEKVITVLGNLYYSGARAWNPIHHRGGREFRNWATPGFHMKVAYPACSGPDSLVTRIIDLHMDQNNPLFDAQFWGHARDFANETKR